MARRPARTLAPTIMARLDELAQHSSLPDGICRLYLSKEHKAAATLVMRWMSEAGMTAAIDAAGTVVGRIGGERPNTKTLLIGSHIDTVHNAGRYDGCLGVVLAIEAMAELRRQSKSLPFAVEVLAFGGEMGVRFPIMRPGSLALAGRFDMSALHLRDKDGITLEEALGRFGCEPADIPRLAREHGGLLGYLEVHIEQGPVLDKEDLAVGVVTAISGASRFTVEVRGRAGHAGTQPMNLRNDALTAAAEMVLAVERTARETAGLVATVGELAVAPGTANAVPEHVRFTIDVRSPVERTRRGAVRQFERELRAIARRRQVALSMAEQASAAAATCDRRFIKHLTDAADCVGAGSIGLPSGAGHSGLAMHHLCPIGTLFVRCKGGLSHHPEEAASLEDVEIAARVLIEFLQIISPSGRAIA